MAPLSMMWPNKRSSSTKLKKDVEAPLRLIQFVDRLIEEHSPYRRIGYPRAGGFDRLTILILYSGKINQLSIRYCIPAPRMIYKRDYHVQGNLMDMLPSQNTESINGLLIVGLRKAPGSHKYGDKNLGFGRIEQGVFLQALHSELCRKSIPNHLQGGIEIQNLPIKLTWDFEEVIGLVV